MSQADTDDQANDEQTDDQETADTGLTGDAAEFVSRKDVLDEFFGYPMALLDECKLRVTSGGLRVTGTDPANVGMANVTLNPESFESYAVGDDFILGLNLPQLSDVISTASSDSLIRITKDAGDPSLTITIDGQLTYNVATIDPDSIREEPDIPDLDLPGEVVLEARALERGLTAADLVSDHIAIEIDDDGDEPTVEITAEGDTDETEYTLSESGESGETVESITGANVESLFSLDYMNDITSAISKATVLAVSVGDDFPVVMTGAPENGTGSFKYLLAPRIAD